MVKLSEIIEFMEKRFPLAYAMDFDNVGLLAGRAEGEAAKALLCLNCDKFVVDEAVREGARLIISHHPVIFGGIKSVTDKDADGEMLIKAIENGISIYCAHTNLDNCPGGLTEYLCSRLELTPLEPIEDGAGRVCMPREGLRLLELCAKIKSELGVASVYTTARMNRPVKRVAVVNGSGGDMWRAAREKGADVYVTGDVKHHAARDMYLENGLEFISVSHYDSEKIVTELLFDALKERFGQRLEAVISKADCDALIEV